jgi:hypothetical protein
MADEMAAERRLYYRHRSEEAASRLTRALLNAEMALTVTSDPASHSEAWLAWQAIFLQEVDLIADTELRKRIEGLHQMFLDEIQAQGTTLDMLKHSLASLRVDLAHHRRGEPLSPR